MLPSSFGCGLGLRGLHFRGHLCVHSRYGPVTRRPPFYDGRVDGLQGISSLPPCHPNYGVLALSPAGLSPAERASLCWTHNRACGFPAPGSRTRSCRRPRKAFACSAFWSVRTLLELLGVSTSLHVLASFLRCSRTEAPSLRRHYPASPVLRASPPPRRPKLVLADSRLASTRHRRGFPCCCCLPLARMPPPIPRRNRSVPASLASRPLSAFPVYSAGRLPHYPFRGLLSVHFALRPACSLNRPQAILLHRSASVQFVTSLHRSDCFRLERQLPGGIRTRWDTAPFHGARKHPGYSRVRPITSERHPRTQDPNERHRSPTQYGAEEALRFRSPYHTLAAPLSLLLSSVPRSLRIHKEQPFLQAVSVPDLPTDSLPVTRLRGSSRPPEPRALCYRSAMRMGAPGGH